MAVVKVPGRSLLNPFRVTPEKAGPYMLGHAPILKALQTIVQGCLQTALWLVELRDCLVRKSIR
jgi:hypothetical protein